MRQKILFIGNNSVVAKEFKRFIERYSNVSCDTVTNKYIVKKLNICDIKKYVKIIIHAERKELFPNNLTVKKLFDKYPNKEKFVLYRYGPIYNSDIKTSFYSKVIVRNMYRLKP